MSELTTFRWSFEEDISHFKKAGYTAVGVWRQKLADYGEDKGVELLAEHGLSVSNLLWCGGFTGSDGRNFREALDDAADAVATAAALRAGCLIVYTGARGGHTHNHARRLLRDALKELLPQAEAQGVTLALKPMHPDAAGELTFLTDVADALALIDAVGRPNLKLAFDTYHLGLAPDWEAKLRLAAPHVAVVHLADGPAPTEREQPRTQLGRGAVPLKEITAALKSCGYDGYYDVELVGADVDPSGYPDLLEHSREAFARLV